MRILSRVGIALLAVLGVLIVVVAIQPAEFAIDRSTVVAAPADVVYPHIENLHAFNAWQPFAHMDPKMEMAYDGPEAGVGAISSWVAPEMGKGRMTITKAEPAREVEMKLEFFEPMAATNRVVFALTPEGESTRVRWRMEGRNGFVGKAMSLFAGMQKMMESTFDDGLAALKQTAEAEAQQRAAQEAAAARAAAAAKAAAEAEVPPQGDEIPVEKVGRRVRGWRTSNRARCGFPSPLAGRPAPALMSGERAVVR